MKMTRSKATKEELDRWWKTFHASRDDVSRNRLIENFLPIVKYTAERLHTKLPD